MLFSKLSQKEAELDIFTIINYLKVLLSNYDNQFGTQIRNVFKFDLQRCTLECTSNLNYRKKVFYFALDFLPWEFLLIKKLDFEKTKATLYTNFKTDVIKVALAFSISNFFTNKDYQGRKLSAV